MKVLHLCPIPSASIILWKKVSEKVSALDWHTAISLPEIFEVDFSDYDLVIIDDYLVPIAQHTKDVKVFDIFNSHEERVLFVTGSIKLRKLGFNSCVKSEVVDKVVHNLTKNNCF